MGTIRLRGALAAAAGLGLIALFAAACYVPPPPPGPTTTTTTLAPTTTSTTLAPTTTSTSTTLAPTTTSTSTTTTLAPTTTSTSTTTTTIVIPPPRTGLILNEVDYDNVGTDVDEFIELKNVTSAPINLNGVVVVLVNGVSAVPYNTIDLTSVGTLASGDYLVIGPPSVTSMLPFGATFLNTSVLTNIIQNGAPDGIAVVDDLNHTLIDALSYEGSVTAATIPGFAGPVNLVEGTALSPTIADSNSINGALDRLPDGTDTDDALNDWGFSQTLTPGAANLP